ncbi:lipase family protein [Paenibacillus sp. P26]|nr:lipase family protein [Paenibacillus sp. P26]UUZ97587.1 lipase family protein [Paenibacillus sp. P25]
MHGTWSDGDTWKPDFVDYVEGLFHETSEKLNWSGGNTTGDRSEAAEYFAQKIYEWHEEHPDDPIRLVGHSHGGNVAVMVTNILAKKGLKVPNLITIATPVRGYQLETDVGQHIHVYNDYDGVQINGGSIWAGGNALREFPDAENVNVSDEIPFWWGITSPKASHSIMHSNVGIWKKYIEPILVH